MGSGLKARWLSCPRWAKPSLSPNPKIRPNPNPIPSLSPSPNPGPNPQQAHSGIAAGSTRLRDFAPQLHAHAAAMQAHAAVHRLSLPYRALRPLAPPRRTPSKSPCLPVRRPSRNSGDAHLSPTPHPPLTPPLTHPAPTPHHTPPPAPGRLLVLRLHRVRATRGCAAILLQAGGRPRPQP